MAQSVVFRLTAKALSKSLTSVLAVNEVCGLECLHRETEFFSLAEGYAPRFIYLICIAATKSGKVSESQKSEKVEPPDG